MNLLLILLPVIVVLALLVVFAVVGGARRSRESKSSMPGVLPSTKDLRPKGQGSSVRPAITRTIKTLVVAALVVGASAMHRMTAFAQETPVPLVIPLNNIFIQANNWLQTLSPVMSLGIGIVIALAVYGILTKTFKTAFA